MWNSVKNDLNTRLSKSEDLESQKLKKYERQPQNVILKGYGTRRTKKAPKFAPNSPEVFTYIKRKSNGSKLPKNYI